MVSSVVAASAAVLILVTLALVVISALVARRATWPERKFEAALRQLDVDMQAFALTLERVVERSAEARQKGVGELALIFDLDDLLSRIAAAAATRTEAHAAAVRIEGPGPAHAVASYGSEEVGAFLEGKLRPPGQGHFRALTVNWTLEPSLEGDTEAFRSALVVPILEEGLETGALATYARTPAAFRPEHAQALEALAAEAAPGIASARRLSALALRMRDSADPLVEPRGAGAPTPFGSGPVRAARTAE
jgi:GAF domain-containing protein